MLWAASVCSRTPRAGDGSDLTQRRNGADLAVGVHHRYDHGAWSKRTLDVTGVNPAIRADRDTGDGETSPSEPINGGQYRFMLADGSDDVIASLLNGRCRANEGEVVALGSTGGKHNLRFAGRTDEGLELPAGSADSLGRLPTLAVRAGGVGVDVGEIGQHGFEHAGIQRCGGLVVQIDRRGGHAMVLLAAMPAGRMPYLRALSMTSQ